MKPTTEPKTYFSYAPEVKISIESLEKAKYLVKTVHTECQWYFTLDKTVDRNKIIYYLNDFVLPVQEVTGVTVESEPVQMYQMLQQLQNERELSFEALGQLAARLNCWCHSHVNMQCSPSGTDDSQWKRQKEANQSSGSNNPQAMIIMNKRDEYFLRIYDPEFNIEYQNLPIQIDYGIINVSDVDRLIDRNISKRQIVAVKKEVEELPFNIHSNSRYSFLNTGNESLNKHRPVLEQSKQNKNEPHAFTALQKLEEKILAQTDSDKAQKLLDKYINLIDKELGPTCLPAFAYLYSHYSNVSLEDFSSYFTTNRKARDLAIETLEDILLFGFDKTNSEDATDDDEDHPLWSISTKASSATARAVVACSLKRTPEEMDSIIEQWIATVNTSLPGSEAWRE